MEFLTQPHPRAFLRRAASALSPFILATAAAAATQGAPLDGSFAEGPMAGDDRHSTLHYVEHSDGTWVRGKTFKARAHEGGFTYIPFLGSEAPRSYPIDFRLSSARLGGESLDLAPVAETSRDADRFTLDRGPVRVHYDVALEFIEQSFALDIAGADGDLVLELEVASDLRGTSAGGGLVFRDPGGRVSGGVDYSAAIVFDGAGRRADVPMTFDGEYIQLTVPASFLRAATGPVVVDPIVSTFAVDEFFEKLDHVDVGFDRLHLQNTYVYEEAFSVNDVDIYSRTYDSLNGTLVQGSYIELGSELWRRPKIANIDAADQSLIVAERVSLTGVYSIVGRYFDEATALGGAFVTIATPPAGVSYRAPDVGGDNDRMATSPRYLVSWSETNLIASPLGIALRTVSPSGSLGTVARPVGLGVGVGRGLVISKGNSSNFGLGEWNIAYRFRSSPGANVQIGTGSVNSDGFITTNAIVHALPAGVDAYDLDISESIYAGGFSPKYLISYDETVEPNRSSKRMLFMRGLTLVRAFDLNVLEHGPADRLAHGIRLATTWTPPARPEFVAAYHQEEAGGTTGVYVTTLDTWGSSTLAISEHRTRVATSNPYSLDGGGVALTSRASSAFHSRFSLLAWTRYNSGSTSDDIYAATHTASTGDAVGQQFCESTANSTGERGFLACYGSPSTTAPKELRATHLPQNSVAFFVAGQGTTELPQPGTSVGVLCLGGAAIGRYSNAASSSGSSGTVSLNIDPTAISTPGGATAAVAGQTWGFQLWHRDAVGGASVSNFTNAVRVTFE